MGKLMFDITSQGIVDTRPSHERIWETLGDIKYNVSRERAEAVDKFRRSCARLMPKYPETLPVHGFTTLIDYDPRVEIYEDVLFVPGDKGGLFDRGRRLIAGSGYYRTSNGQVELAHGQYVSPVDPDTVGRVIEEDVAFGGIILPQFGHFLVGSLSRFWNAETRQLPQVLINLEQPSSFFKAPFMADCLGALGIGPQSFRRYLEPVRLRRVVVPYPAFEEGNIAHLAYGRMCAEIAASMGLNVESGAPVFLSRTALTSGIGHVVNEGALCDAMARLGFDIVSPEKLSFRDQVALFRNRPKIAGLMGSAMHVSAFAPGCRLVAIANPFGMQSNQILVDKAAGNRARYLYDTDYFAHVTAPEGFAIGFKINDPKRIADDIVRSID